MTEHGDGSPVARVPKVAELVADDLRRRIVDGALSEGEPLPAEAVLMQIYNVSRPTLREALRILEHDGLIVVKRGAGGGARVTVPDLAVATRPAALLLQHRGTTLADLFEAVRVIETAAVRRLVAHPDPLALAALERTLEQECALRDDWDRHHGVSAAFHVGVVEASGNKTLAFVDEFVLSIVEHHHRAMFRRSEDRFEGLVTHAIDRHRELLELVRAGDAVAAEQRWRDHLDEAEAAALRWVGQQKVIDLFGQD